MKGLLVIGAGGHGKVVADTAQECGQWDRIGFLDDRYPELLKSGAWPVIGKVSDAVNKKGELSDVVVGIGDNTQRTSLIISLKSAGRIISNVIHPQSFVSSYATIGEGTVIFAQAAVNVDVEIKAGCIINTGASIDHDCIINDGVHVSPGATLAGLVNVGQHTWVGIGASIRQQVRIGENVIIGAGAAVVDDLPDGVTVVGVPARIKRS